LHATYAANLISRSRIFDDDRKKRKKITYSVAKKRRVLRGLIDVNRLNLLFLPSPELIKTGVEGARVLF
jgi:hypothetical protein